MIFAIFLLYNSHRKMLYCCGRKKISARSSFLFRRKMIKIRNLTEVNCMDSCDSTGRSTKCGVAYRETQDAAIGAVTENLR